MDETRESELRVELTRRFGSDASVMAAVSQAVHAAVLEHKLAGNPLPTLEDGRVALVQSEDITAIENSMLQERSAA